MHKMAVISVRLLVFGRLFHFVIDHQEYKWLAKLCIPPTPMCAHAVEDVQSGVVLSVVRVQLPHQAAVAHPVQKHVGKFFTSSKLALN